MNEKPYRSSAYDLCVIFNVFWSHSVALCEEQTEMYVFSSAIVLKFP